MIFPSENEAATKILERHEDYRKALVNRWRLPDVFPNDVFVAVLVLAVQFFRTFIYKRLTKEQHRILLKHKTRGLVSADQFLAKMDVLGDEDIRRKLCVGVK